MAIYTGKLADGSDMKEFSGVYTDFSNETLWSNKPYNKKQRKDSENYQFIYNCMAKQRKTLNDIYHEILNKKSTLTRRYREYVLSHFNKNGNFIKQTKNEKSI